MLYVCLVGLFFMFFDNFFIVFVIELKFLYCELFDFGSYVFSGYIDDMIISVMKFNRVFVK